MSSVDFKNTMGSSPRVRGKQLLDHVVWHSDGLIPARAGKTSSRSSRSATLPAHPRVCGENRAFDVLSIGRMGSSPRMRGKRSSLHSNLVEDGLIPAHAGKTTKAQEIATQWPAHPRACGENSVPVEKSCIRGGSSPRMRGKLVLLESGQGLAGLIPAHAGKTTGALTLETVYRAHPRACGENGRFNIVHSARGGSSPRMRGKRGALSYEDLRRRLIPAHAGKTAKISSLGFIVWAHPRACGENGVGRWPSVSGVGSSPRMRGKRAGEQKAILLLGLIPAHAGKTLFLV